MSSRDAFAVYRALVIQRHRHLKWVALDPLEAALMVAGGVCIGGFTLGVFLDVLTRTVGHPWLWLQQATTAFFAWGVFVGMAVATRRHDHIYLSEITKRLQGARRTVVETANRLVVLLVAGFMAWFGLQNAILDFGSYRMPWLIPLTVYTGIVPVCGVLVVVFSVEQMVNGIRHGYEGPEDAEVQTAEPVE